MTLEKHNRTAGFELDGPYYSPARQFVRDLFQAFFDWLGE